MSEPSAAKRVVDILKRELPGFAAEFHAGTDSFRVRGPVRFASMLASDWAYAVPDDERFADRVADRLIEATRRNAIEALGIEKLIVEREERAQREGYVEGYSHGKVEGIKLGRIDVLAEILAARAEEAETDG